jgi:hypothetical protein
MGFSSMSKGRKSFRTPAHHDFVDVDPWSSISQQSVTAARLAFVHPTGRKRAGFDFDQSWQEAGAGIW